MYAHTYTDMPEEGKLCSQLPVSLECQSRVIQESHSGRKDTNTSYSVINRKVLPIKQFIHESHNTYGGCDAFRWKLGKET